MEDLFFEGLDALRVGDTKAFRSFSQQLLSRLTDTIVPALDETKKRKMIKQLRNIVACDDEKLARAISHVGTDEDFEKLLSA